MTPLIGAYIAIAILFGVANKLISRHSLMSVSAFSWALFYQFGAGLMFLPFAIKNFSLPTGTTPYIALASAIVVWTIGSVTGALSYKHTFVSLREPVSQSRILWAFILGIFFLHETFSLGVLIGTILIFIGIAIAIFHPERKLGDFNDLGVRWTLVSSAVLALATTLDKFSLRYFSPEVYGFAVYFIPGTILLPFAYQRRKEISELFKHKFWAAVGGAASSAISGYFTLKALMHIDITIAFPILQTSSLLVVFCGIFLLKEKDNMVLKIVGTAVTILGVILLK